MKILLPLLFALTLASTTSANEQAPEPQGKNTLSAYVLDAMRTWNKGPMAGSATHLEDIANDIAIVAQREPRIWKDSDGSREAILLARVAWFETRFRDYVDSGDCNRWATEAYKKTGSLNFRFLPQAAQRDMQLGDCDGGNATSIWQVHFGDGIFVHDKPDAARRWWHMGLSGDAGAVPVTKDVAIANRQQAARVALAMMRQSIQNGAGLMGYVGGEGPDRLEKARQRLDSAVAWSAKHPYTP